MTVPVVEALLRRERLVVGGALALTAALAWGYTLAGAGTGLGWFETGGGAAVALDDVTMTPARWTAGFAALMLAMWWLMMIAMMLPSAAPVVLLAAALNRAAPTGPPPFGGAAMFTAGYLVAWLFFSVLAVAAQAALQTASLLTPMMRIGDATVSAVLLVAAGLWQLTPAKRACLRHCRSPAEFLTRRRRPGHAGALRMGVEHGAYCLGCCWALMALLFVGGVMDVYWILGLTIYVMVEKWLPGGERIGRIAGVALIVAGLGVMVGG